MQQAGKQVDIHALAGHSRFNGFHGLVLWWCVLILVIDGYDLAVVGAALPSIMKDMASTPRAPASWPGRRCSEPCWARSFWAPWPTASAALA